MSESIFFSCYGSKRLFSFFASSSLSSFFNHLEGDTLQLPLVAVHFFHSSPVEKKGVCTTRIAHSLTNVQQA